MLFRILYLCFNMRVVATQVEYSTPDQFAILKLYLRHASQHVSIYDIVYEVQVQFSGLETNRKALNANGSSSVNVDVQCE